MTDKLQEDRVRRVVEPLLSGGDERGFSARDLEYVRDLGIECKILHGSLERTVRDGLAQTAGYMVRCAAESGHLVVFDRGEGRWEDKVFHRREPAGSVEIDVWGM